MLFSTSPLAILEPTSIHACKALQHATNRRFLCGRKDLIGRLPVKRFMKPFVKVDFANFMGQETVSVGSSRLNDIYIPCGPGTAAFEIHFALQNDAFAIEPILSSPASTSLSVNLLESPTLNRRQDIARGSFRITTADDRVLDFTVHIFDISASRRDFEFLFASYRRSIFYDPSPEYIASANEGSAASKKRRRSSAAAMPPAQRRRTATFPSHDAGSTIFVSPGDGFIDQGIVCM